jgi:hypothetical protein
MRDHVSHPYKTTYNDTISQQISLMASNIKEELIKKVKASKY